MKKITFFFETLEVISNVDDGEEEGSRMELHCQAMFCSGHNDTVSLFKAWIDSAHVLVLITLGRPLLPSLSYGFLSAEHLGQDLSYPFTNITGMRL